MRAKITSIELGGSTNLAVLAPIKPGFVDGFETVTYLERLRRLLEALQAARQNVRESELFAPALPDSIGRFGIIRSFRYAIVPPYPPPAPGEEPGASRLSLNVTFDGGWEPYMRVIYRDIGTLLDALFCHCLGYPGSRSADFDTYCRWVRDHEIDAGIFYTDAASVTQSDERYLAAIERLQRETADPQEADRLIASFALDSERAQVARALRAVIADPAATLALPLRTLKGLYRLAPLFPDNQADDGGVLLRFAQAVLKEFAQAIREPALRDSPAGQQLALALADELAWFARAQPSSAREERLRYDPSALQAMILARDDPVTHGCLVLLGVRHAEQALGTLAGLAERCAAPAGDDALRHHVAFTYAGLRALRIPAERLDALPQEFIEGMEARCGLLGDVRGNHPDHWVRPLRHGAVEAGERIDLSSVHAVVMLRLIDAKNDSPELHPRLARAVEALHTDSGLAVLAVQPTRSYREDRKTREHFGFVDGLSQPQVVESAPPRPRSDEVSPGELLLGYGNDRGDGPFPRRPDALLDNGCFLVVRKLRQRLDHLRAALAAQPEPDAVLARMMGRRQDGTPLVPPREGGAGNDFDYDADGAGAACPMGSHVRRANPRDGRAYMPRLLRRGMSYGPRGGAADAERGIVFMAYCASIAEQFETVQRWIAGGNSSGLSSSQADPFLGVPQAGEKRVFRYFDAAGRVARVDLGDKPFVQLEWGLYLFVPSLKALAMLAEFRQPPLAAPPEAAAPAPADPLAPWRARLEDRDRSEAAWAEVRAQPGARLEAKPYGTLLGSAERVLEVLKDNGTNYSVQGYGRRMAQSIGLNHLGMDPFGGHDEQAPSVNEAIERIDAKQAFEVASALVAQGIARCMALRQPDPDPRGAVRAPVDLIGLSEYVLAGLCTKWIGLPEDADDLHGEAPFMVVGGRVDAAEGPPRCPGHLLSPSRFIFSPHPREAVVRAGLEQGPAALHAVEQFLASGRRRGRLTDDICAGLRQAGASDDDIARCIAGVLLGFPPTVHGNFLRTMQTWIEDKLLWACQQRLAEVPSDVKDPYERARLGLLDPLLETMRRKPVPEVLWRCPVLDGKVQHDERVVLGIASALTEPQAPHELLFGGARRGEHRTVHACPGYSMGLGVLLALTAGLLDAGTLRTTGSPVLLMLTPA